MDQTNRVLAIGVALLWIFLLLLVILLAWGAPDESINRLADLAGYLDGHNTNAAKLIVTFGGLIFVLLGVIVIILEVSPPETGSLKVATLGSGEGRIGTDEVVHQLEEQLGALPQVSQARATVLARGRKADVKLDLYVTAEADLASTTEEACRHARELVEGRMGIALTRPPQAQLHYRELRVARRPQPSPSAGSATPTVTPARPPTFQQPDRPSAEKPASGGEPASQAPTVQTSRPTESSESTHERSERTTQEDRPAGA